MFPTTFDLIRTLAAVPLLAFLSVMALNEYFFVPRVALAGAGLILAAGLVYRVKKKERAYLPFWLTVFLSAYNFPMAAGGYLFLGWKMGLALVAGFSAGYFLLWKARSPRRVGMGLIVAFLLGTFSLHFHRQLDFDQALGRCEKERMRVSPVVRLLNNAKHPYDFARVPATKGRRSRIVATYGLGDRLRWFDAAAGGLVRESRLPREGEVQRLTPNARAGVLYAPPWARRGRREEILVIRDGDGEVTGTIPVNFTPGQDPEAAGHKPINGCRNLFEILLDPAAKRIYALCEVSHSLVRLDAETGQVTGYLELPGRDAYDMVLDPVRRRLFVTDYWSRTLSVVEVEGFTLEKSIPIGWSSFGIVLAGDRVFVARPLASEVVVVDADELKVVGRFPAGYGVRDLEVDEERGILYAGNYFEGTLDAIALDGGRRLRRVFVGKLLRGLLVDPDYDRLYLAVGCGVKTIDLADWLGPING